MLFLKKLETQGASGPVDPNTPGFGYAFIEFANIEVLGETAIASGGTTDITTRPWACSPSLSIFCTILTQLLPSRNS